MYNQRVISILAKILEKFTIEIIPSLPMFMRTPLYLNILKIRNKINTTVKKIIKFNPNILLSVDSPDFTLRVAEKVKQQNPNIRTIHYVSPQIWVWRKDRIKKYKNFAFCNFLKKIIKK